MAIRVHKENANKQGKELYGGRNNHRRVKKRRRERGTTQESWVSAKREKRHDGQKKETKKGRRCEKLSELNERRPAARSDSTTPLYI